MNLFKKERELTTSERLQVAQSNSRETISSFQTAYDELEEINNNLLEIIKEDESEIKYRTENRDQAISELSANRALQQELKRFLPQEV